MGHHLATELLGRGVSVSVLNRGMTPDELPPEVERLRADRTDEAALSAATTGREWDGVVDMVAYEGPESAAAARVFRGRTGHFIHISTGQIYLVLEQPPVAPYREDDDSGTVAAEPPVGGSDHAGWVYGVGKRACEAELRSALASGFPCTVLRLPMVQGERDYYERLQNYVARILDGGPILTPAPPHRLLRHVDALDVARVTADLLVRRQGIGRIYNLTQDEPITLANFLQIAAEAAGRTLKLHYAPREVLEDRGLLPGCSPFSGRWMSILDNGRARAELGAQFTAPELYVPRIVEAALKGGRPPREYEQRQRELEFIGEEA